MKRLLLHVMPSEKVWSKAILNTSKPSAPISLTMRCYSGRGKKVGGGSDRASWHRRPFTLSREREGTKYQKTGDEAPTNLVCVDDDADVEVSATVRPSATAAAVASAAGSNYDGGVVGGHSGGCDSQLNDTVGWVLQSGLCDIEVGALVRWVYNKEGGAIARWVGP